MTLNQIAADMVARLADKDTGQIAQTLPRGLKLVLRRDGRQWTLSLGRSDVQPSINELYICARAFNAPPGTDPVWTERNGYKIVEIQWMQEETPSSLYEQNPLISLPPAAY